ncbi:MAG: SH3 domain-containing protein [Chloroflexi bacterium]|nr:SH3 domain-containing protein [Chloroflexota bacterium]
MRKSYVLTALVMILFVLSGTIAYTAAVEDNSLSLWLQTEEPPPPTAQPPPPTTPPPTEPPATTPPPPEQPQQPPSTDAPQAPPPTDAPQEPPPATGAAQQPSTSTPVPQLDYGGEATENSVCVAIDEGANIRSGSGTEYPTLARAVDGSCFEVLEGPVDGWYRIRFSGGEGWVYAELVSQVDVALFEHGEGSDGGGGEGGGDAGEDGGEGRDGHSPPPTGEPNYVGGGVCSVICSGSCLWDGVCRRWWSAACRQCVDECMANCVG